MGVKSIRAREFLPEMHNSRVRLSSRPAGQVAQAVFRALLGASGWLSFYSGIVGGQLRSWVGETASIPPVEYSALNS